MYEAKKAAINKLEMTKGLSKMLKFLLVASTVTTWLTFAWPQIYSLAEETTTGTETTTPVEEIVPVPEMELTTEEEASVPTPETENMLETEPSPTEETVPAPEAAMTEDTAPAPETKPPCVKKKTEKENTTTATETATLIEKTITAPEMELVTTEGEDASTSEVEFITEEEASVPTPETESMSEAELSPAEETTPAPEGESVAETEPSPVEETIPAPEGEATEDTVPAQETESPCVEETTLQTETTKESETTLEETLESLPLNEEPISETEEPVLIPLEPVLPPLKERKLEREITLDENAMHACRALDFNLDISGQNFLKTEFFLEGRRDGIVSENLEIGSLPRGIDVTFSKNAGYVYAPERSDNSLVLDIENQASSQKGNFNVAIIYTATYEIGSSTALCQINLINF